MVRQKKKNNDWMDKPLTRGERAVVGVYGTSAMGIMLFGSAMKSMDVKLVILCLFYGSTILVTLSLWTNSLRK